MPIQKTPSPLEIKVALLYHGMQIPPKILNQLQKGEEVWNWGRKGGAGPAGGRYFALLTPEPPLPVVINISLQSQLASSSPAIVESVEGNQWNITYQGKPFCTLGLLPVPRFHAITIDRFPADHYAVLHGKDCLATTVNQRCIYWRAGQECRFCGIELSLDSHNTVEVKDAAHLSQVLTTALAEVPITHLTLTIGTQPDASRGIIAYIPIVQQLKAEHPEIRFHAQFEPPRNMDYITQLKTAGCDTVGIHVEILGDEQRHSYCPGKGHLQWGDYVQAWRAAVKSFGKNQVDSYILLGLELFGEEFYSRIKEMCEIGVVPFPVPVREIPGTNFSVPDVAVNQLVVTHKNIATIMKETGISPSTTTAGCVRCSACSAIGEAFINL